MSAYEKNSKTAGLIKKFISNWYWFLLCLILAGAAAWYLLVQETVIYNIAGSIIVNEERQPGNQLPEETIITGLPFNNRGSLNRQMQILKSRNLMEKVVDSLNLDIVYYAEERFKNVELYHRTPIRVAQVDNKAKTYGKILRVKQLDSSRFALIQEEEDTMFYNFGVPFEFQASTFVLERDSLNPQDDRVINIEFNHPLKVAIYYSSHLMLRKLAQSNVLEVSLEDEVPEKVVDIIHALVEAYNIDAQDEKNRMAGKSLEFIAERLQYVAGELSREKNRQASIQSSNELASTVDMSAQRYFDKLSSVEEGRTSISNLKSTMDNLEAFLSNKSKETDFIPNFGDMGGMSFAPIITQYNRAISERKKLLATATEKHPGVIKATEELGQMRSTILNSVSIAKSDLEKQENQLAAQVNPVQQKIQAMPFVQKRLNETGRTASVQGELFSYLLKKREETAIGLAANVESVRILDEPVRGNFPSAPNKKQFFAFALLLGLGIPAGIIYMLDKLNDKIMNKEEVKAITGDVPFLGEVAFAKSARSKLITDNSRSVVAEMFRIIRTNLQFLTAGAKQHKTILVSSYISGDGKTFVSGNLAACLALTSKKTVVLELDLRRPKLTELILQRPPGVGVTNYLVGENEIDDIIQKVEGYDHLYMISAGPTPPNPAELIMSEKMDELMAYLQEKFDYVVLDTPPVGLVTDAYLLNRFVSNSIFVVRANKTKKDELQYLSDICKDEKLTHPAIILNGTKSPKRYGYYY